MGRKRIYPYECTCGCFSKTIIRSTTHEATHLYSSLEARKRIANDPSKICSKYLAFEESRFRRHCVHVSGFVNVDADVLLKNAEMREVFVRLDRGECSSHRTVSRTFIYENFFGENGIWKGVRETLRAAGIQCSKSVPVYRFPLPVDREQFKRDAEYRETMLDESGGDEDSDKVERRPVLPRAAKVPRDASEDVSAEEPPTKAIRLEPSGEKEEVKQAIGIHHALLRRASLVTPRGVEPPALKLVQFDPGFISNMRRDLASFVRKPVEESNVWEDSDSLSFVPITRQDVVDVEAYSTCTEDMDDGDSMSDLSDDSSSLASLDFDDDVGVMVEDAALEAASPVEKPPSVVSTSAESLSMLADCAAAMCNKPVSFEICIQPAEMVPVVFVVPTKPGKLTPLLEFGIVSLESPRLGRRL